MKIEVTAEIWQEGNMFVGYCHELEVASAGRTSEEALRNLSEAIGIFLEETAKKGSLPALLEEAGFVLDGGEAPLVASSARSRFCAFEKLTLKLPSL